MVFLIQVLKNQASTLNVLIMKKLLSIEKHVANVHFKEFMVMYKTKNVIVACILVQLVSFHNTYVYIIVRCHRRYRDDYPIFYASKKIQIGDKKGVIALFPLI